MHLIGSPASPFVQRCAIVARAKGLDIAIEPPPGGAIHSAEFQAMAPMGRIPLLVLDDGSRICESAAIAAYLDEVLDGPALQPANPRERARVREVEAIATLELAAGLRPVLVHRVFRVSQNEPLVAAGMAQADKGCAALTRLLADAPATGPYVIGDTLSLADAVLVPLVALAGALIDQPEVAALHQTYPLLAARREQAQGDPVLARSLREMEQGFAAIRGRMTAPAV
ncbi:MAG TPA: glutathione S-transferase family protein [Sphingobium sp.]|nr:glutathione S-transferase family protein [Sphingobium sp.]